MRPHKALLGSFAVAVADGDADAVAFAVAVAVAVADTFGMSFFSQRRCQSQRAAKGILGIFNSLLLSLGCLLHKTSKLLGYSL